VPPHFNNQQSLFVNRQSKGSRHRERITRFPPASLREALRAGLSADCRLLIVEGTEEKVAQVCNLCCRRESGASEIKSFFTSPAGAEQVANLFHFPRDGMVTDSIS
jgi:hypothetical protein